MSAVRLTTSLSPRVFFSMQFSSALSWVAVVERVREHTSGVVT